jgi:hypothetical protein
MWYAAVPINLYDESFVLLNIELHNKQLMRMILEMRDSKLNKLWVVKFLLHAKKILFLSFPFKDFDEGNKYCYWSEIILHEESSNKNRVIIRFY